MTDLREVVDEELSPDLAVHAALAWLLLMCRRKSI